MKAWSLKEIGKIEYIDIEKPLAKAGEVIVKVSAAGICGSDIPRIYKNGAHKMPLVLGHEFSGVVAEVGEGVSEKWIGKKVGVFPLIPCKECAPCMKKQYEMCKSYSYLGSRCDGGFAEYVAVPEWNLLELPEDTNMEAAAMLEPMAVSVHAIRKAKLEADSKVVVWGAGTIGILLTMFLVEMGIKNVLVVGNHAYQKDFVKLTGLTEDNFCNSISKDADKWISSKTDNYGPDVFIECVGKNETFLKGLELTAPGGQIVTVGNPYSDMDMPKDLYWNILRKQYTVSGTWNSAYYGATDANASEDDWNYVLKLLASGEIHPEKLITHRLSPEKLNRGFEIMKGKTEPYIKVMSVWE